MGGERVPVGDEEQARMLVLQLHPVLQHAVVVAEMQCAGRAHPGQDSIREHRSGSSGKPEQGVDQITAQDHQRPDDSPQHARGQEQDDNDEAIGLNHSKPDRRACSAAS